MRYLRPIPKRLLPDDMLVYLPAEGGGHGEGRLVRYVRFERTEEAYVNWAGDTASLTDRLTGARTKVYVLVVALPYSGRFWAQGFTDMKQIQIHPRATSRTGRSPPH